MKRQQLQPYQTIGNSQGFSLIEALIAIAIFSFGLLAIGTLTVSSINGNATARRVTESAGWASDRIERLMAVPYEDLVTSAAPIQEGGYSISWDVTTGDPMPNVKAVQVTILNARSRPKSIQFDYYKVKQY